MFEALRTKLYNGEILSIEEWNSGAELSEFNRLHLIAAVFLGGAEDFRARYYEYRNYKCCAKIINDGIYDAMSSFYRDSLFVDSKVARNIYSISCLCNGELLYGKRKKYIVDYISDLQNCPANTLSLTDSVLKAYNLMRQGKKAEEKNNTRIFVLALHCMREFNIDFTIRFKTVKFMNDILQQEWVLSQSAIQLILQEIIMVTQSSLNPDKLLNIAVTNLLKSLNGQINFSEGKVVKNTSHQSFLMTVELLRIFHNTIHDTELKAIVKEAVNRQENQICKNQNGVDILVANLLAESRESTAILR